MTALLTADEFREAEGYTADPPSDDQIESLILVWQSWLERATGQFFDAREATILLDGSGSDLIQLSIPIIEVEWLRINDSAVDLTANEYVVYNGLQAPNDDRQNPRVKLKPYLPNIYTDPDLYMSAGNPNTQRKFLRGYRNQSLKGTFGYVEPAIEIPYEGEGEGDPTIFYPPPPLILKALKKLVLRDAKKIASGGSMSGDSGAAGTIIEEWTDGHKYKLAEVAQPPATANSSGDAEVDRIVMMYRRPLKLGHMIDG